MHIEGAHVIRVSDDEQFRACQVKPLRVRSSVLTTSNIRTLLID